ncbi:MAG: hypothetical protein Q8K63_08995 [Acidimicrobiales bacterium]|nr:hypothetical protein [Acidimicrobiales bacterium]
MTTAVDVSDLGRLQGDGPFLSVYLPTEAIEQQWANLRKDLVTDGTPDTVLGLIDTLVEHIGDRIGTLAIVTDASQVLVEEYLTEPLLYSRGGWSGSADLVPIIKDRQERGAEEIDDDEKRRAVKTEVAEDTVELLETFKSARERDRAADGIRATVDAVNRAEVDVLLVRDDRDERRDVPREDAAVIDALVRDAIATGASVRVIPASGPVTDGVGALLR